MSSREALWRLRSVQQDSAVRQAAAAAASLGEAERRRSSARRLFTEAGRATELPAGVLAAKHAWAARSGEAEAGARAWDGEARARLLAARARREAAEALRDRARREGARRRRRAVEEEADDQALARWASAERYPVSG